MRRADILRERAHVLRELAASSADTAFSRDVIALAQRCELLADKIERRRTKSDGGSEPC